MARLQRGPGPPVSRALMAQVGANAWGYQMAFVRGNPVNTTYASNAANHLIQAQRPVSCSPVDARHQYDMSDDR